MKTSDQNDNPLLNEVSELRQRIAELESREHEHKQTEKALRESEDRLRVILESVQTGIVIIDSETHRIVDANPIASKLIGAPKGQIIGSLCHKYICPAEEGRCPITDLGQTVDNSERVLLTAGGGRCPVIKTVEPVILGGRKHLLESLFDITERKRTEEVLREREERYRILLETMEEGYFEVDLKGNFTFVNESLCKKNGLPKEKLLGMNNRKYMSEETARKVSKIFKEVYRTGQHGNIFDWEIIRSDGQRAIMEGSIYLIRDAQGEGIGFRGIVRDITERKKAEEALRETEDRYRDLVENCHDLICTHDLEGNLLWINSIPAKILGYERSALLKMNLREILAPEVQKQFSGYLDQMKKHGRAKGLMVVQTARGERRFWEYNNTLREEGVATPLVRGIAHDITDRKQMEEALRKREVEAQRLAEENAFMAEIGRVISSTLNIDEVYELFSEKVKSLIPYDRIAINLINKDGTALINRYVQGDSAPERNAGEVFPRAGTVTETVIQNRTGLIFDSQEEKEVAARYPGLLPEIKAGFRSFLSVPLISRDQPIGGLHFRSKKYRVYSEKDLELAESIANQIAGALANAQLFAERRRAEEALRESEAEAKRLAAETEVLAKIGRMISSTLNTDEVYELLAEEVRKVLPFDRMSVNIIDRERNMGTVAYVTGVPVRERDAKESFPLAGSLTQEGIRTREGIIFHPQNEDEVAGRFPTFLPTFQSGLRSMMMVPLISKDHTIGILYFMAMKPQAYTPDDLRLGLRVGNQIAGAMANVQLFAELKRAEEGLRHSQEVLEMKVRERTEDLVNAKDEAEAASRAKSEFLANMSHELRTPLNHIIGFTELVVDKQCGDLNEVQKDYLNDALQSSRHLLSLINDILDLSKVEAGKLELEVAEIHLRMLLEGSLSMVKEKAMKHRIRLLSDINGIPEAIQADERKLKQILYNLLSNAVKFTPDGGSVTLLARYLSFREGQWFTPDGQPVGLPLEGDDLVMKGKGLIDISVQDTDIGIKGEDLKRIFNSFEQVESSASRRFAGTGLGLSLTRRLVELHGGRIWAESEGEGKGSKFILLIPV